MRTDTNKTSIFAEVVVVLILVEFTINFAQNIPENYISVLGVLMIVVIIGIALQIKFLGEFLSIVAIILFLIKLGQTGGPVVYLMFIAIGAYFFLHYVSKFFKK